MLRYRPLVVTQNIIYDSFFIITLKHGQTINYVFLGLWLRYSIDSTCWNILFLFVIIRVFRHNLCIRSIVWWTLKIFVVCSIVQRGWIEWRGRKVVIIGSSFRIFFWLFRNWRSRHLGSVVILPALSSNQWV